MNKQAESAGERTESTNRAPDVQVPKPASTQPAQPDTSAEFNEIEREMNSFERSTLKWTRATFAVLSVTCLFIAFQWHEMKSGSADTHALAVAAGTQAGKMQSMSDAADKIGKAAENMVTQDQRIADNAQKALEFSNKQTTAALAASINAARLDERAWVAEITLTLSEPTVGKPIEATIAWKNSGKTFAKHVMPNCSLAFSQERLTEVSLNLLKATLEHPASVGVLAPDSEYKTVLKGLAPIDEVDKSRITGTWYTYLWGEITYFDIFKQAHTTKFCSWRQGGSGDFLQCPFKNDAD